MKVVLGCIPCYLKQVINTLGQLKLNDKEAREVLHGVFPLIAQLDPEGTPAENSTLVLQKANELIGEHDPFARAKKDSNELALSMLPKLRKMIERSNDRLYMALQVAVAGNIIDMGIIADFDVEESLKEALSKKFARDDYREFRKLLGTAQRVMILGDNSGEIAFDDCWPKSF